MANWTTGHEAWIWRLVERNKTLFIEGAFERVDSVYQAMALATLEQDLEQFRNERYMKLHLESMKIGV